MKNYIQHIIELFGHNEYSLGTRRRVQQWLADENHAEEKKEALHALWQQAGEQKVPRGMQQSIQRMQRNIGMQPAGSDKKYPYMESGSYFLVGSVVCFNLSDAGEGQAAKGSGRILYADSGNT